MTRTAWPFISLMVPCRNEREHIHQCLTSILANDYPADRMEVLVIDGMSADGTREIVAELGRTDSRIQLLDNPRRVTPSALNIGVRAAKGELILRMDAHAHVESDYVRRCVDASLDYGADNVGGIIRTVPRRDTLLGRAIAAVLSHRFGVGNAYSRVHVAEPTWFSALFCGCYRADVFRRVGLFNERLVRGQDMEFNLRLERAGGRGLLVPDIVSTYYAQSELMPFLRHTWTNGVWAIVPFAYSDVVPVSWRHLVPLAFVGGIVTLATAGFWFSPLHVLLAVLLAVYAAANLAASASIALKRREGALMLALPFVFFLLHVVYGLGSGWGIVRLIKAFASRERAAEATA